MKGALFHLVVALQLGGALASALGQTTVSDCASTRELVDRRLVWKSVAEGLEFGHADLDSTYLRDLTVLRFRRDVYKIRAFDLRDVVSANQSNGYYAPPLYSIGELQHSLRNAVLIASAGLTKSYSEPVPAGFLRIDGTTRAPVAPRDRTIDGVVCVRSRGHVSILSEIESGSRRAPKNVEQCVSGFQAGPVLVDEGIPTSIMHKLNTGRVVFGLSNDESMMIGYSSRSTTAALGCALTGQRIAIRTAINLQGDSLGGVALGPVFQGAIPVQALGTTEATVASALVVEARQVTKKR
jgi:hypothetical protein